jgi:hypothetical protein
MYIRLRVSRVPIRLDLLSIGLANQSFDPLLPGVLIHVSPLLNIPNPCPFAVVVRLLLVAFGLLHTLTALVVGHTTTASPCVTVHGNST